MKRVAFYTLGCKLNFSESSAISKQFAAAGYTPVSFAEPADVYVINTCSVTDHADKKCRKVVNEALKKSPSAFITVVGCYAQLKPAEIAGIPGVDVVLGAAEKFNIVAHIGQLVKSREPRIISTPIEEVNNKFIAAQSFGDRTRSFLKVQDGCDYPCTYCTIPLARGASRSDTIDNVVARCHDIAARGVKEIILTGVNIGDFGIENGRRSSRFFELIKRLDDVQGIDRFRISSIEPNLLTDDIIEFVAHSKRFVPHFHIPLQSGSDVVLGKMKRRYNTALYRARVEKIKELMPDCCIGVDVIVGFPGETDELFTDSFNFINRLDISYLHVFTYSERENTPAAEMPAKVAGNVKHTRNRILQNLSDKKRRAFYEGQLGKCAQVLFEAETDGVTMQGFTGNYVKVSAPYNASQVNKLLAVTLKNILPGGEVGIDCTEAANKSYILA